MTLAHPEKTIGGQHTICPLIYNGRQYMPYALYLKRMVCGDIPSKQSGQELGWCLSGHVNLIQNLSEATGSIFSTSSPLCAEAQYPQRTEPPDSSATLVKQTATLLGTWHRSKVMNSHLKGLERLVGGHFLVSFSNTLDISR
jgi:hypothetical protein